MNKYQNLESVGTILWLITDFVWMSGYNILAAILTAPVLLFLTLSWIKHTGKKSELYALIASCLWFVMNMLWIYSDIGYKDNFLLIGKFSFGLSIVFVCMAIIKSKQESESVDFKRLNIK